MQQLTGLLQQKQFAFIKRLQKKFPQAEIFLVGGIVRDTILKRESKDYDFVVRNVPAKQLQQFLAKEGWVDLVGKNFGVFKFIPRGFKDMEALDIALPRTEHAFLTGGYKDFDVQSDPKLPIEEDLKRRDFIINALAFDIQQKKIIDLFGGLTDIKKKIIRTVGKPTERFKEDYSRILRALRFACQLDFAIAKQTWSALQKLMKNINNKQGKDFIVPRETIAKEMVKAFTTNPACAFELFDKSGAIKELMPELLKMKKCPQPRNFHSEGDVWKHTKLALENLRSKKFKQEFGESKFSSELIFGLMFHDMGKPYTMVKEPDRLHYNNHDAYSAERGSEIMERLKLSSTGLDIDKTCWLISRHMIVTHTKRSAMKKTTLEKYFYNPQNPGLDLMKLMHADIEASIPYRGKPDFSGYNRLRKEIDSLNKTAKKYKVLPKEILDGFIIMKILNLKPGKQIGTLKELLREEQLKAKIKTKEEAIKFLKNKKRRINN
jgi:tRNA nucleotidyltransferase/poly(A) polymerase